MIIIIWPKLFLSVRKTNLFISRTLRFSLIELKNHRRQREILTLGTLLTKFFGKQLSFLFALKIFIQILLQQHFQTDQKNKEKSNCESIQTSQLRNKRKFVLHFYHSFRGTLQQSLQFPHWHFVLYSQWEHGQHFFQKCCISTVIISRDHFSFEP